MMDRVKISERLLIPASKIFQRAEKCGEEVEKGKEGVEKGEETFRSTYGFQLMCRIDKCLMMVGLK